MSDPFVSHPISLILSWILLLPYIAFLGIAPFKFLFNNDLDLPKWLTTYILIAIIFLSPAPYLIFQLALIESFTVQSINSFLSSILFSAYFLPAIGLISTLCITLPIGLCLKGLINTPIRKTRHYLLPILGTPVLLVVGTILFYSILPYSKLITSWIPKKELIQASNGPTFYAHKLVEFTFNPIILPEFFHRIEFNEKSMVRFHITSIYGGDRAVGLLISEQHPELKKQLITETADSP